MIADRLNFALREALWHINIPLRRSTIEVLA